MSDSKKLSPCHCINLRRTSGCITEYYDRAVEPCGLTISQFSLLWNLDFLGQSNTTALAARMDLDRSTLARNLRPLLANGFIEDAARANSRNRMLKVTPKGKMALEIGIPLWKAAQKKIIAAIGEENLDIFKNILSKLQGL